MVMSCVYFLGAGILFHLFYLCVLVVQVLKGLEAATNCVDDMDEWLGIFNVKLRHMREDIESVGTPRCI